MLRLDLLDCELTAYFKMNALWKIIFAIGVMLMISAITGIHQLSYNSDVGLSLKFHTLMSRALTFALGAGLIAWTVEGRGNPILQLRYTRVALWIIILGCLFQSVSIVSSGYTLFEKIWVIISHTFIILFFLYLLRKKQNTD